MTNPWNCGIVTLDKQQKSNETQNGSTQRGPGRPPLAATVAAATAAAAAAEVSVEENGNDADETVRLPCLSVLINIVENSLAEFFGRHLFSRVFFLPKCI